MRIERAAALAVVEGFGAAVDTQSRKSRDLTAMLVRESAEPFSRGQFGPGHVTCTSVVLSPDRGSVLLIWHKKLERWLLPGGHVEPEDGTVWAAARREVDEETGVKLDDRVVAALVNVDVHGIPARGADPYHLHHDLIFGFVAADLAVRESEETPQVRWCLAGELEEAGVDWATLAAVENARRLL